MTNKTLRKAVADIWEMSREYDCALCLTDGEELDELHRREKLALPHELKKVCSGLEYILGFPREGEPCKLLALRLPKRLELAALYVGSCEGNLPAAQYMDERLYTGPHAMNVTETFVARTRVHPIDVATRMCYYLPGDPEAVLRSQEY